MLTRLARAFAARAPAPSTRPATSMAAVGGVAIEHRSAASGGVFSARMDDGAEAVLEYGLFDGVADFAHTFTPPSARGKGVAAKLGDAAFAWAREQHLAVRPSCSYISGTYLPSRGAAAGFRVDAETGLAVATP